SSGSVATLSTTGITGRVARRPSYAFRYRWQWSHAYTRYCPSGVANDVMRDRSLLPQYGQVSGSNFQRSAQRLQIRWRSAAGGNHREVRFGPAERAMRVRPERELRALLQD